MKLLITPNRIRSIIADARTEKDVELTLRQHKVRYAYDTRAGFLAIRVTCRTGAVLVYRSCSRSAPFKVCLAGKQAEDRTPFRYPYTVPQFAWDD